MVRTVFSGQGIISVLTSFGYVPKSNRGSHVRLGYENSDTVKASEPVTDGTLRELGIDSGDVGDRSRVP